MASSKEEEAAAQDRLFYRSCDKNGNNQVTLEELQGAMHRAEANVLFEFFNEDKDTILTEDEYVEGYKHLRRARAMYKKTYQHFSNPNQLQEDELKLVIEALGRTLQSVLYKIIAKNANGDLGLAEVSKWWYDNHLDE